MAINNATRNHSQTLHLALLSAVSAVTLRIMGAPPDDGEGGGSTIHFTTIGLTSTGATTISGFVSAMATTGVSLASLAARIRARLARRIAG